MITRLGDTENMMRLSVIIQRNYAAHRQFTINQHALLTRHRIGDILDLDRTGRHTVAIGQRVEPGQ